MKVLVATKRTQGQRTSDFTWTEDGEYVRLDFECDSDRGRVDGGCGCRRSFSGFRSQKATTTAEVIDTDLTPQEYVADLRHSLGEAGWLEMYEPEDILDEAARLLRLAKPFALGTVVEKRGDVIQERVVVEAK